MKKWKIIMNKIQSAKSVKKFGKTVNVKGSGKKNKMKSLLISDETHAGFKQFCKDRGLMIEDTADRVIQSFVKFKNGERNQKLYEKGEFKLELKI